MAEEPREGARNRLEKRSGITIKVITQGRAAVERLIEGRLCRSKEEKMFVIITLSWGSLFAWKANVLDILIR